MRLTMEEGNTGITNYFLGIINWTTQYGLPKGETEDTPLFRSIVPDSHLESGMFSYKTATAMGGQNFTLSWRKEGVKVIFRYMEITRPQ